MEPEHHDDDHDSDDEGEELDLGPEEEETEPEDDDDDDDEGDHDEDETGSGSYDELDDLSERELEEMAASTRRSLLMVQMQVASYQAAETESQEMDIDGRTPEERWQDFLGGLPQTKVLKITDTECKEMKIEELQQASPVLEDLVAAVQSHEKGLTHVILEGSFLKAFRDGQRRLFEVVWSNHCATITYLKLGSDECPPAVLDLDCLLTVLKTLPEGESEHPTLNLTEIELRSAKIETADQIASFQQILSQATKLKQLNLLGMLVETRTRRLGLLDPILSTVAELSSFDECRLSCLDSSTVPLVSSSCLAQVFVLKQKWWRIGLDGVGLEDEHCKVMAEAMSEENCKAGDLLSLTLNPAITDSGWNKLFDILFQKQRMGLVKVDNVEWQANFDLVRCMNNLHGRLGFQESGSYPSRSRWVDWLAKLSQITWEDDAHILNYLHFSLLERPDFIHR